MCENTTPVVLVGGGGHALSTLAAMPPGSFKVVGYVDRVKVEGMPLQYLGNDDELEALSSDMPVLITMVSGRDCSLASRRRLILQYQGHPSPVVVAPTAIVAADAAIGDGTVIFHRAVVNTGTRIGWHAVINTGAIVEHGATVGHNTFIGPGAVICGGCNIGSNVYIGANATVKPGVTICSDVVIGLGAAVINDITTPGVYAGVPAKPLKQ